MPKKKPASGKRTSVRVGNISDISGNVNVAGGNVTTHHTTTGLSAADIKQLFDQLYTNIDARTEISPAKKEDVKAEVQDIQTAVTEAVKKNEPVNESLLSRKFRSIARMAPDMLEVLVATLGNPLMGIGVAVKKIADKAKEEA